MSALQVGLKLAKGSFGVNKLHALIRSNQLAIAQPHSIVIFFLGDRIESIDTDPSIQRLQDPATVAQVIGSKFPSSDIVVVSPSRVEGCFSCYDHFLVKHTLTGEPLGYHGSTFKASQQLLSLLEYAEILPSSRADSNSSSNKASCPKWHVVGFSKGGVVLNQILSEVSALNDLLLQQSGGIPIELPPCADFLQQLCEVHYLDVGLNCRGAYTTDPRTVQSLGQWTSKQCRQQQSPQHTSTTGDNINTGNTSDENNKSSFRIALHGTPRQWCDMHRPWVSIEKNTMMKLCREAGVTCVDKLYFEGQKGSLKMHFDIIEAFDVNC